MDSLIPSEFNFRIFLTKVTSRKFIVFLIATIALFAKWIDGLTWAIFAGAYIGLNLLDKKTK